VAGTKTASIHGIMLRSASHRGPLASVAAGAGLFVKERITIQVPPDELFDFWRDLDNLPRVMPFLRRVEWDAEITNEVPDELIAWRSRPGTGVAGAGFVRLKPAGPFGTRITLVLQYESAGGRVAASIAALFGRSPAMEIRKALLELRRTMEAGRVTWRAAADVHGLRGKAVSAFG
jgi:uncharacterized membrane protein